MAKRADFDQNGHEILDPTPVAIPLGYERPESLEQKMMRFIRHQLSSAAQGQGMESFDEANDFDIDDDDVMPLTHYELADMHEEKPFDESEANRDTAAGKGKTERSDDQRTSVNARDNNDNAGARSDKVGMQSDG